MTGPGRSSAKMLLVSIFFELITYGEFLDPINENKLCMSSSLLHTKFKKRSKYRGTSLPMANFSLLPI